MDNETGIRLVVTSQVEWIRQIGLISPITLFHVSRPFSVSTVPPAADQLSTTLSIASGIRRVLEYP